MKSTINVNIGGQSFVVDEDAYHVLSTYLESWEINLSGDSGKREILDDMEARIAELFLERVKIPGQVVTLSMVEEVITIMGKPDQAGSFDEGSRTHTGKPYRRMYRDPDNRFLGGVCSGMGLYWRVDPIIFRLVFILAFFTFFSGVILYLLLWIAIPKAVTPAQKLEMRGEPITVENIRRAVANEFNEIFSKKQ
ncbi:MAG TPA: PspC domain-containing protein [Williamwhitmania sp.]|nr:PspC domain-containing protein [Williamwhitmania sp.]